MKQSSEQPLLLGGGCGSAEPAHPHQVEARIETLNGRWAEVRLTKAQGGCGRCHEKGGCGGSVLSDPFRQARQTFTVENTLNAQVGDVVWLEIAEGATLRAAGLVYGLPLFSGLLGASLGTYLASPPVQDIYATGGLLVGLILGLVGLRLISQRRAAAQARPQMRWPDTAGSSLSH